MVGNFGVEFYCGLVVGRAARLLVIFVVVLGAYIGWLLGL